MRCTALRCIEKSGDMMNTAFKFKQVTALLSVNERTVYGMAQAGRYSGLKVEGTWWFLEADIDVWIQAQKNLAGTEVSCTTAGAMPRQGVHLL